MAAACPGFPGQRPGAAEPAVADERERLRAAISDRGIDFVGQEVVRLSTTPVWENGRLTPRPFVLRVFAAATPNGWTIMPGGFCRIAEQADARAVSMGDGARAADVWVVSDKAVRVRRCCRRSTPCASAASPACCRAGPPTICSGSAAISSAPKRRCG